VQWGWYIGLSKNAKGLGNAQHYGHLKMKPDEVKKPLASIGQDKLRLVQGMAEVRIESGAIGAFVQLCTGTTLSAPQIQYASKLCKENPTLSTKHGGSSSPADRLIEYLSSEPNISYILLFAEPSSSLLSIPKQRKKTIKCIMKGVDGREQDVDLDQASISDVTDVTDRTEDTPEQYADRIRNALTGTIKTESKVLLAVAWVTDAQRRMLALFPEALCADVMFKSNAEQRPLFSIDGKTSENETFRALHAFMPSTCRFVYQWLFSVAVPKLHSKHHLCRNEVMGLDGEERQYSAFVATIPTVFPRSTHILCSWHLFDRGQKESGINLSLVDNKNQVQGKAYMKVVTRWLFSWTDSVESRSEFELSYKLLLQWLGSSDLTSVFSPLLVERITNFVAKSVVPHLDKILLSNRMRRRCFDMRTTSNSEAENSVVKRHPVGPRPNE
jgi:hypothetical protein